MSRRHNRAIEKQADELQRRLAEVDEVYAERARHERQTIDSRLRYLELQAEVMARQHLPRFKREDHE